MISLYNLSIYLSRIGWGSSLNSCWTFVWQGDAIIATSHLTAPMAGSDYCADWFGIVGGMLWLWNIDFLFWSSLFIYLAGALSPRRQLDFLIFYFFFTFLYLHFLRSTMWWSQMVGPCVPFPARGGFFGVGRSETFQTLSLSENIFPLRGLKS